MKLKFKYCYDAEKERWTAVCPKLFLFIIHAKTEELLKKECLLTLKKYLGTKTLTDYEISFENIDNIVENNV